MSTVHVGNGSNTIGINYDIDAGEHANNVLRPEGASAWDGAHNGFAEEDGDDDNDAGKQEKNNNMVEEGGLLARPK